MKARIHHQARKPDGSPAEIHIDVNVPFPPPAGSHIKVTENGDYLVVDGITLDVTSGGEGLSVYIVEPAEDALWSLGAMECEGWRCEA